MATLKPTNQKSLYASYAHVYESLMNDAISVEKAEQACNSLNGMNRAYALEIKRAEVEKNAKVRIVESTNFEE